MKYYYFFALVCCAFPVCSHAQLNAWFKDLEGNWVEDGRKAASFIQWEPAHDQTVRCLSYSLLCGDTVLLSTILIHFTEQNATMEWQHEGTSQFFILNSYSNNTLFWENTTLGDVPHKLSWSINYGRYLHFTADELETDYTKSKTSQQLLKWTIGALFGANMSQYNHAISADNFLARNIIENATGNTEMLPGLELALTFGFHTPKKPLGFNAELGLSQRNVAINGTFTTKNQLPNYRNGYYRTNSLYAALVPELFLTPSHRISVQAGFYAVITHDVDFRGRHNFNNADVRKQSYLNPALDIDLERGFLLGIRYKAVLSGAFKPHLFMRYSHGINRTQVRALTIGMATDFHIP